MQNNGTLTELPLSQILETVQKDRATGTLHVKSSGGDATLYFLFGHLFHAQNGDRQGEDVVFEALAWADGDFTFDSKAKLPAEETIKISTADILAQAPNGAAPMEAPEPEVEEEEEEAAPAAVADPEPEPAPAEPAAPAAKSPKRRRSDQRPGTRPPETMELYPVPRGKLIYESLTASFVDFPKVLRSLGKDNHTGYVRLSGEGFDGVLLFSAGAVVESIYDAAGEVSTGKDAFDEFASHIEAGEGELDVIELSPELVTALYQLLTAPSLYERLMGRFIRADALLEHLSELGASGAVIVRSEGENGIVLFRDGQVLGSYTGGSRDVDTKPTKFLALCEKPQAEIEVRGGPVPEMLPVMEPTGKGPTKVPSGSGGSAAAVAEVEAPVMEAPAEVPEEVAAPVSEAVDWDGLLAELASRADAVLGTRSKKVKEMLSATEHSREGLDATFDRISELSIMFVDPSKLTALADEMRSVAAGVE